MYSLYQSTVKHSPQGSHYSLIRVEKKLKFHLSKQRSSSRSIRQVTEWKQETRYETVHWSLCMFWRTQMNVGRMPSIKQRKQIKWNIFSVSCWMRKKNKKSQMKSTNIISVCVFANKRWVVLFYRLFSVSWPRRVASYLFDYAALLSCALLSWIWFFCRLHRIANELKSLRDVDGSYEPTVANRMKHCWRSNELFRACRLETAWLNEFCNGSLA